jgi:hypothetical protein
MRIPTHYSVTGHNYRFLQGRPTEATKEASVLTYGDIDRKDYIPGAEVLKTEEEIKQTKQDQGKQTVKSSRT